MKKILGGWSMSLARSPFYEFDYIMYGMVTNLEDLTTGTPSAPGWSPERESSPVFDGFMGKTLWVYGGGGCRPAGRPASMDEVSRIVCATQNMGWGGVDFDDECNMNTALVIETMKKLKENGKETSFGFVAGYSYNHPDSRNGKSLTAKVKAVIDSGYCDRLVHYCYAASMWNKSDILNNVRQALEKSLSYGMDKDKIILALTTKGLTDWNLNYFLDQLADLDIGGLFIWRYDEISADHLETIKKRLDK